MRRQNGQGRTQYQTPTHSPPLPAPMQESAPLLDLSVSFKTLASAYCCPMSFARALSGYVAACFTPSRWPITTWFYWKFDRPNQIRLPIGVYLLHIKEKEEKHFLMGTDFDNTKSLSFFSLEFCYFIWPWKKQHYSWKSVQKHSFMFYIPTCCPQFILGFWIEMFSCRDGECQLIFGIRGSKGQIQPSTAEIDCKGNLLLNSSFWVWKNFWSRIECSVLLPILEVAMSLDCIMTPYALPASLLLKTLGRAGEILNNRIIFSFRLIKNI